VQIHYMHLYRGVVDQNGEKDTRGPCGCHLGPRMCQYIQDKGHHQKQDWNRVAQQCKEDADEKFNDFLSDFLQETKGFTAFVGSPSAPSAMSNPGGSASSGQGAMRPASCAASSSGPLLGAVAERGNESAPELKSACQIMLQRLEQPKVTAAEPPAAEAARVPQEGQESEPSSVGTKLVSIFAITRQNDHFTRALQSHPVVRLMKDQGMS
jgi:hypothetical protein